ncbi:RHS repeat-associated core domain-containing protein [Sorangium sp. So ce341]|uniref:RHS repeat-associated core domain-containing protein n=1 Tax=Sorangium sp. So ce341 TaxID=3133302 RepID=UPI003F615DF8
MARTAPVPNIPAIPGMNPGVFVMGGGAGGGGAGGRRGNGSGGQQGGRGRNGGRGAEGGSRNACSRRGSCVPTHPGHRGPASRGDPVDVMGGRTFVDAEPDLALPGPLPFVLARSYSSDRAMVDVGFGHGWSHSFAWSARVGRRAVEVTDAEGAQLLLPLPGVDEALLGAEGWVVRRAAEERLELVREDGLRLVLDAPLGDGKLGLSAVLDRYNNRISLIYERGILVAFEDSAGRAILVRRDGRGRIAALEVPSRDGFSSGSLVVRYSYTTAGDLAEVVDPDGFVTSFDYEEHRITKHRYPGGMVFHYRYDAQGRCVETWGAPETGVEPCLDPDLPATLADRRTPAKGILHCVFEYGPDGYCEVVDAALVQRYSPDGDGRLDRVVHNASVVTRTYDERGHVASYTDPLGATIRWERDECGRPLKITDPIGRTLAVERDTDGHIRSFTDPSGATTTVERVGRRLIWRDPIGAVFEVEVDERGLTTETVAPNGGRTRYRYDRPGNLIERTDALGRTWRFSYDFWGRRRSAIDPAGAVTWYSYSARGDLLAITDAEGRAVQMTYDGLGNVTAVTYANGRTERYRWGGLGWLHQVEIGGAVIATQLYDREGRLVAIIDAAGARHTFEHDARGLVLSERSFDGAQRRYGYDLAGRLTSLVDERGERTELLYDLAGQLVARLYDDGSKDEFTHDEAGRLVEATRGSVRVELRYNAVGWLVEERQTVGAETMTVHVDYDAMGRPVRRWTERGRGVAWERDLMGGASAMILGAGQRITFEQDEGGRERARVLPGGGRIEMELGPEGLLRAQRVSRTMTTASVRPGEPAWVGEIDAGLTVARRYDRDADGELLRVDDSLLGAFRLDRDALGRLAALVGDHEGDGTRTRHYLFDPTGNLLRGPAGEPAEFGPGNRLKRVGGREVATDAAGRVIAITEGEAGHRLTTRFVWDATGLLEAVERPDGTRVAFAYDTFARRLAKRVIDPAGRTLSSTRYVWDGARVLEERRRTADGERIRVFLTDDESGAPLAQAEGKEWFFCVADELGAVHHLVRGDGQLAGSTLRDPWGGVERREGDAEAPLGFLGQIADEETGLFYNRYRYYDPRIGRYLSPDPLGVHGGLNVFSYADNDPSTHVDPDGLLPMAVITQPGRPDIVGRSGQVPQRGDPGFDPAVGYAHYNARVALGGGPGRQAGNEGCAEISALHQMAQQIRADNPNRRMSRAEVRREMQRRFRNGARISTNNGMNGGGPAMCPCHMCAQTFRELGLHPGNINQGAAANATGGVAAPNPGRGNNRGLWDGQSIWRNNRNENTSRQENDAANGLIGATQPSRTPPFTGT